MRKSTLVILGMLAFGASVVSPFPEAAAPRPAIAAESGSLGLALLSSRPGALHTSLYVASPVDGSVSAPLATFTHLPGAVVRGAAIPGTDTVLATADTAETRDVSFNASLFRLAPHSPPVRLCDSVVHASRPLVTESGRVLVARGAAGDLRSIDGALQMRVDALSIDEVDPATGDLRTVTTLSGVLLFGAGSFGNEVIVYRVSPNQADIAAIDIDTGKERVLVASLPAHARDFSVDAKSGTLVFQGRDESDSRLWTIESVNLKTLARTRLYESRSMNLIPYVLSGGAVAYNPDGREGLRILDKGALPGGASGLVSPFPKEGADWIQAVSNDGRFAAALRTEPSGLPVPFVIDTESGRGTILSATDLGRVYLAGFIGAEGGVK